MYNIISIVIFLLLIVIYAQFSDMKFYAVENEDMNDIWYPSIYIGNGLKFKNQESFGPEPKSLNSLW